MVFGFHYARPFAMVLSQIGKKKKQIKNKNKTKTLRSRNIGTL
jgi:hypothetical protein